MQNITLWCACPWTLSVAAVQAGGLNMVALGLTRLLAARLSSNVPAGGESSAALRLCIVGLLGVFAVGYPGYFVFDAVWPSFYYSPVPVGKNAWLLAQAFFIGIYFAGAVMMFNTVRRALNAIPARAWDGAQS
jgi:RsiW-degrading membrane proteinase PrsW (M82 family)